MRTTLHIAGGLMLLGLFLSPGTPYADEDQTLFGRSVDRYGPKPNSLTATLFGGFYIHGRDQALLDSQDRFSQIWDYGLRMGWAFHEMLEVEGAFGYTPTKTRTGAQNVYWYAANALGQYMLNDQITPYVTAGIGGIRFSPEIGTAFDRFAINYGAGFKFFVLKNLAIRPDFRAMTSFDHAHTSFLGTLNLTYYTAWGPPVLRDRDRDGIPDERDTCPTTKETKNGFQDEDGCPDEMPPPEATPAPATTPEPGELRPIIQETTIVNPPVIRDRDEDGIIDEKDLCPDQPEVYNGFKDEDGCPDEEIDEFNGKVDGINFKTGSSIVTNDSYPVLDRAAKVLKKHDQLKIRIDGHTDKTGSAKLNDRLSAERADSVRQYLIHAGVESSRLQFKGWGFRKPIATNKTPAGRLQNRRIEFTILNPESLPKKR